MSQEQKLKDSHMASSSMEPILDCKDRVGGKAKAHPGFRMLSFCREFSPGSIQPAQSLYCRETHHSVWAVCVGVLLLLIRPTFPYYRHKSMSQLKACLFSLNYTKALNFSSPPLQLVTQVCLVSNGPVNTAGELTILHLLKSGPPNTGVICTTAYAVCHLHF